MLDTFEIVISVMIFILFVLILYKIILDEEAKRYIKCRDMKQKREIALKVKELMKNMKKFNKETKYKKKRKNNI